VKRDASPSGKFAAQHAYGHGHGDEGNVRLPVPVSRFRRSRRGELLIWWREIDRWLLAMVLSLVAIGVIAVAAASPASAHRLSTDKKSLGDLYFFWLHLRFLGLGLIAMFVVSLLPKQAARRLAIVLCAAMVVGLLLVPLVGGEVKGAKRWLWIGISLQPSEFGATMLFCAVWFVLALLAGLSPARIGAVGAGGVAVIIAAYLFYPNAQHRIDAFLSGGAEFDQVDLAMRTLVSGGWNGAGLWLGTRKMALPEAHTDYIFSVIGEEFGLVVCAIVVMLYCAIAVRVLLRLIDEDDLFTILAGAGLTAQLVGQAFINILVNLQLFPSKGMTLPLISYGGSSTIALLVGVGFLLAITRRNPYLTREAFPLKELARK
jgi:cell division protein FtsW